MVSRHKKIKIKLFSSVMPAGWRQSSVGSSTPAAELPAVVATKVYVDIWGSRACQEQIQSGISIRSWTCRHSKACCQHCLSHHYIPGVFTYDQPNVWTYMKSKNWFPSIVDSVPFRAYLHPSMYLLSCVNWMDENMHSVYRAHNQLNWKCPNMANTRHIPLRN